MNLDALAKRLAQEVDAAIIENDPAEHRRHLGASLIGRECHRALWSGFRWLKLEHHNARMKRLFNRGHEEEVRFTRWLTQAGWRIDSFGNDGNQFRMASDDDHYGGSLDGFAWPPQSWKLDRDLKFLAEFKTHGDKSYKTLEKDKLKKAKPEHYVQMCSYGWAYQLRWGLYCAVNKNTDEIHWEFVELDWKLGEAHARKADVIIHSRVPPKRIADAPTDYRCKTCHFAGICHFGDRPEKNCRSCTHSVPVDGGRWSCERYGLIPPEFIPTGCGDWEPIV